MRCAQGYGASDSEEGTDEDVIESEEDDAMGEVWTPPLRSFYLLAFSGRFPQQRLSSCFHCGDCTTFFLLATIIAKDEKQVILFAWQEPMPDMTDEEDEDLDLDGPEDGDDEHHHRHHHRHHDSADNSVYSDDDDESSSGESDDEDHVRDLHWRLDCDCCCDHSARLLGTCVKEALLLLLLQGKDHK